MWCIVLGVFTNTYCHVYSNTKHLQHPPNSCVWSLCSRFLLDLKGKTFRFSSLSMVLIVAFYVHQIEEIFSIHSVLRIFIMNGCWILSNMIYDFFFLNLMWWIRLTDFWVLNGHIWDKSNLVMVYNCLMHCWIQLANMLLNIFALVFMKDIGL